MCLRLFLGWLMLILIPLAAVAQKKEQPRILIYGSDIIALNAAVQSARSHVPTVWVWDEDQLAAELTQDTLSITSNLNLDGGLWMEMLMEMGMSKSRSDSLASAVKRNFNPRLAKNAIEKIIANLPNLTIVKGETIDQAERRRKGWQITLSNNQKYQVVAVVDASRNGDVVAFQKRAEERAFPAFQQIDELSLAASRTTLAVGEYAGRLQVVLLADLLQSEQDNLFDAGYFRTVDVSPESIPFRAALGQALGATAGYCAFFKTQTDKIDIRKLQSELLAFRARLNPYQDVSMANRHFSALQKLYLTGFFMGERVGQEYHLKPDQVLRLEEVQDVLNSVYTRSQLWFLDHSHQGDITWGELMELTKFVSFKGDEIVRQVERDWRAKFHFEGTYDPECVVTRLQFAVITDLFSDTFAKAVNLDGSFVK